MDNGRSATTTVTAVFSDGRVLHGDIGNVAQTYTANLVLITSANGFDPTPLYTAHTGFTRIPLPWFDRAFLFLRGLEMFPGPQTSGSNGKSQALYLARGVFDDTTWLVQVMTPGCHTSYHSHFASNGGDIRERFLILAGSARFGLVGSEFSVGPGFDHTVLLNYPHYLRTRNGARNETELALLIIQGRKDPQSTADHRYYPFPRIVEPS